MSERKARIVTRRQILEGSAALAVGSLLPRFALGQSNLQPQPTLGTQFSATSAFTIGTSSPGTIPTRFVGFSYEKSNLLDMYFSSSNNALVGLFNFLCGSHGSVLRIGGDSQDNLTYNTDFNSGAITSLAGFLSATPGWQCIYGINLKGQYLSAPAQGDPSNGYTTTSLAHSEVDDVQTILHANGAPLLGIAIGNEPDSYSSATGTYPPGDTWGLSEYETLWNHYRTSLSTSAPIVGSDAGTNAQGWEEPFGDWTQTQSPPIKLALLTHHYYISNGQASPAPTVSDLALWCVPGSTSVAVNNLRYHLANYLEAVTAAYPTVPWRMDECNSYYNGGAAGVSDAFVSALWVIDYLFTIAESGGAGVNIHGGGHGIY